MKKFYPEERLAEILEIMEDRERIDVNLLSDHFNVTSATIRNDLKELENRDLIKRTHGGAILNKNQFGHLVNDLSYHNRIVQNSELKKLIGKEAAKLLKSKDNIMIDDGSTNLQVVKHLSDIEDVTIITNGLNICDELSGNDNVSVIVTGGLLNKKDMSFYGKIAEDVSLRYHVDKVILGVSGLSLDAGITAPDEEKAEMKKLMIKNSKELIVVADHTKINKQSLRSVCSLECVSTLVTDYKAFETDLEKLRVLGINVIVASKKGKIE